MSYQSHSFHRCSPTPYSHSCSCQQHSDIVHCHKDLLPGCTRQCLKNSLITLYQYVKTIHQHIEQFRTTLIKLVEESDQLIGHFRTTLVKLVEESDQLIGHFRTTLIKLVEESDQLIRHFKTTPVKLHQ